MTEAHEDADTTVLLTHDTAKSLLGSTLLFGAENERPWSKKWLTALRTRERGGVLDQLWDSVLLRTFDTVSGSQPDAQHRMLARAARMALDTEKARRDTLTTHADHRLWEDTPYISFTKSPDALQSLAESRMNRNRGNQLIVVVDPRIRLKIGLPVLHYKEEMVYYEIQSRYERNYWDGHYLCLWEVTPEEVVGVWEWDDLRSELNWFEEIIMPAVEEHREERDRRKAGDFPRQLDYSEVEDGTERSKVNKIFCNNHKLPSVKEAIDSFAVAMIEYRDAVLKDLVASSTASVGDSSGKIGRATEWGSKKPWKKTAASMGASSRMSAMLEDAGGIEQSFVDDDAQQITFADETDRGPCASGGSKEKEGGEKSCGYNINNEARLENPDTFDETDDDDTDDNADDDAYWSESEDSDERVCNENWTGELMKMYEDLRVD